MFESISQEIGIYQRSAAENYVLVHLLIMFYLNRRTVVYKVIGYVICSFIDNFICLDYLGILKVSYLLTITSLKNQVK